MENDSKLGLIIYMHFGDTDKKQVKCSNCIDFKTKECIGKGLKYEGVIGCMEEKASRTEIFCSDNLIGF